MQTTSFVHASRLRSSLLAVAGCAALAAGCGDSDPTAGSSDRPARSDLSKPTARAEAPAAVADRRRAIRQALARARRHVHVPVVLPADLPDGTELAGHAIIDGTSAQLALRVPGHRSSLTIQYGKAGFDGCGPLHPRKVTVRGQPAVIATSEDGDDPSTTLVWPTTLDKLRGRYGLSGAFTPAEMLAFAESMERARAVMPRAARRGC